MKSEKMASRMIILEKYGENGYPFYRIPGIVCTGAETLLVYYECRNGQCDWSVTDLALRRSDDGGKSWSPRRILVTGMGHINYSGPSMIVDHDLIHFLWVRNGKEIFYSQSSDDALSWSVPVNITAALEKLRFVFNWTVAAIAPGHGIVMKNGRLLCSVWLAGDLSNIYTHANSVISTLYSDDHGMSWHAGEIIPSTEKMSDPSESALVQLSDGTVLINCRHTTPNHRKRKVGISPDGISSWKKFRFDRTLDDPVCFGGMTSSGKKIWFVNCADSKRRELLTLRESVDDARSWPRSLLIARDGGYADVCYRAENDMLYVIGETGRGIPDDMFSFHLTVTRMSPSELLPVKKLH